MLTTGEASVIDDPRSSILFLTSSNSSDIDARLLVRSLTLERTVSYCILSSSVCLLHTHIVERHETNNSQTTANQNWQCDTGRIQHRQGDTNIGRQTEIGRQTVRQAVSYRGTVR